MPSIKKGTVIIMSSNQKIKILFVGVGGFADTYFDDLFPVENPDFEIAGGVDPYADKAKYYSELVKRGIPIYSDMEDFYKEHNADLAIISTPIHLHTRQTLTALAHGTNVLCEKPLSGVSADAEIIEKAAKEAGKFVMIGYQWSYSQAITDLKADILAGKLGAPEFLKTLILWPRKKEYFTRGSGWAGKLRAKDGSVINDSIAANACAHYIHNILYVCGEDKLAAEARDIKADLIRVNDIENFDNATISFSLDSGAKCLFVAAHSANKLIQPEFEYKFENAVVRYKKDDEDIVAYFNDGTEKNYGNPFGKFNSDKAFIAIEGCRNPGFTPACSHLTAAAHTRLIEAVQTNKIMDANPELIREDEKFIYIDGLDEVMQRCYKDGIMLRDTDFLKKAVL